MEAITIQRSIWINAPRERVWQAVTDPAQVATWFAPGAVMNKTDDGRELPSSQGFRLFD